MRIEQFHYYLLDKNDNPKQTGIGSTNELFNVISGNISYDSLGRLKSSLEVEIEVSKYLNIDYLNDRIKLEISIDGVTYNKGIYLITSSKRSVRGNVETRVLTCYSKLKLLDNDKTVSTYYLPKGASIYTAITNLLGTKPHNIPQTSAALNTDYTGKISKDEINSSTIGVPKLNIINDLLDIINYNSLTVDDNGVFTSSPYVLPDLRQVQIRYEEGEPRSTDAGDLCRLITPDFDEDLDVYDVPNMFTMYTNDYAIVPPIVATYPLQQSGQPPITIDGRDPNVYTEAVTDVADYATLYAKCKKKASESRSIYSHLQIETAISAKHGYMNCVGIKVGDINNKYIETSWSMNLCVGALMKHTLRRVVDLDE